jgi:pimeloyl-ACP methyl ester carboxylesterase
VTVPGGTIEYLDWGGTGPPLVLLAGLGSTGHAFESFAPLLQARFRVVAVTRRGFGASFRPPSGYDTPRLVADVLAVLDELHIARATVLGHSMGGAEAVWLAVHQPARVERVILLESYCYGCKATSPDSSVLPTQPSGPPLPAPHPSDADRESIAAWQAYTDRVTGAHPPKAEVRATFVISGTGRIGPRSEASQARGAIRQAVVSPEYAALSQPTLLILALPAPLTVDTLEQRSAADPAEDWVAWGQQLKRATVLRWAGDFTQLCAAGQVKLVRGGSHMIYLSNPEAVANLITSFASH